MKITTILLLALLISSHSIAQTAGCNTISMPDSLLICNDGSVTLPASLAGSDSVTSIHWYPTAGLSDSTILNPLLAVSTSGWYHLTVKSLNPANLLTNGSFSAGNTGFTSGYSYITVGNSVPNNYGVGTNALTYNSGWPGMGDHTTGTGNMMVLDGSQTSSVGWSETVPVSPATSYIFTVWTAELELPQPTIQLAINGVVTGTFTPTTTLGQWVKYEVTWNSGTATSAVITLTDLNLVWSGNDFALDDISFQQICVAEDSVYINLQALGAGTISGTDSVCPGQTVSLSESVTGGIWSTSNFTVSDITSSGLAKGLVPGRDTILYSVSNRCGLVYTYFPFYVRAYTACHTGINALASGSDQLELHPNPAKNELYLSLDENITSVTIKNILGQRVYARRFDAPQVQLDLSGLPSGIYIVSVNNQLVRKLIKD